MEDPEEAKDVELLDSKEMVFPGEEISPTMKAEVFLPPFHVVFPSPSIQ